MRGLFGRMRRARKVAADFDPTAGLPLVAKAAPKDIAAMAPSGQAARPPPVHWNTERIWLNDELFGDGFSLPGGIEEVSRLVRPIGIASGASLLLIGSASGGAGRLLATQQGLWVRGFEADPTLAALGAKASKEAKLEKRATSQAWDPRKPDFGKKACHHALLLMPLLGAPAGAFFDAVAEAMKPDGHIVMVDIVAATSLNRADPELLRWAALERRLPELPTEADITAHLKRHRYDVRVVDDTSERQAQHVLASWNAVLQNTNGRPGLPRAMVMVEEAERWMLRLRLMEQGKLRLMRWHAIHLGVSLPVPAHNPGKAA